MPGMSAMLEVLVVVATAAEHWLMAFRDAVEAEVVVGIVIFWGSEDEAKVGGRTFGTDASEPWRPAGEVRHSPECPVRYYPVLAPVRRSKMTHQRSFEEPRNTH
jgi:hypothetical protein